MNCTETCIGTGYRRSQAFTLRKNVTQDLIVSIVDNEKLDIRTWVDMDSYKGFTRKGVRLYLFDGNWDKFKELMEEVDKVYQEIT